MTEKVDIWADESGIWHARVSFPEPGYGPAHLAKHVSRIRAKAGRAIRRAIVQRQRVYAFTLRLTVESTDLDGCNVMHSITYRERDRPTSTFIAS
jgi:hypothetical protein